MLELLRRFWEGHGTAILAELDADRRPEVIWHCVNASGQKVKSTRLMDPQMDALMQLQSHRVGRGLRIKSITLGRIR